MKKEEQIKKTECSQLEVISIGVEYLNDCLSLDKISMNGLWSKGQWEKELSDSKKICFGILKNSKIIALCTGWLIVDELQITSIAVHPKEQRQGLGGKILSSILLEAVASGAKKATLEVKKSNSSAQALYLKLNFKVIGIRKKYYKDGTDAITYSKSLSCGI